MVKQNTQEQIDKKEKEIKELKEKLKLEQDKNIYLDIPEKGISITTKQQYNGKTYAEILKEVNEDEIASYDLLQELRNEGFKSGWKKYAFLKDFWVFVPNKDEVSKSNNYVARFYAGSDGAGLSFDGYASFPNGALGVRFIRKKAKRAKCLK